MYGWGNLLEGSLVVDVGCGVGSQSLTLATHHPHLHFIVQDREAVIGDAIQVCALNLTSLITGMLRKVSIIVLEDEYARGFRVRACKTPRFSYLRLCFFQEWELILSSQAQDFFEPQRAQQEEVSVYLLRMILHD